MRTLVIGGTGTVGSEVVRRLLARGASVRVLVRSEEKKRALPRGAEGVVGDLGRPETLPGAFEGANAVFLATALGPRETEEGIAAVRAAVAARRLIYLSIFQLESGAHIPHFASKIPIESAIESSGLQATLLRAATFFQNDLALRGALVHGGVYPTPMGSTGVSCVDVRDIADAAVHALLDEGHAGRIYPIVGPRIWTGPEVAALWSKHLGRPVAYGGDDLEAWAHQARTMLPERLVHDLRLMFESFQERGLRAGASDVSLAETVVGHRMRTYEAFVAETAADWKR
jgi:uncharacterized protein YbjT (DUF2867 family)